MSGCRSGCKGSPKATGTAGLALATRATVWHPLGVDVQGERRAPTTDPTHGPQDHVVHLRSVAGGSGAEPPSRPGLDSRRCGRPGAP